MGRGDLDELRDELASEFASGQGSAIFYVRSVKAFKAGWSALLTALSERAGETEELKDATPDPRSNAANYTPGTFYWKEQVDRVRARDRARIALAEHEREMRKMIEENRDQLRRDKAALEARLAEYEKQVDADIIAMEHAVKRIKELEAALESRDEREWKRITE